MAEYLYEDSRVDRFIVKYRDANSQDSELLHNRAMNHQTVSLSSVCWKRSCRLNQANDHYRYPKIDYDPTGNVVREQITNNALGEASDYRRTEYEFDSRNRMSYMLVYNQGTLDSVVHYVYDAVGNVTSARVGMSGKSVADGQLIRYVLETDDFS